MKYNFGNIISFIIFGIALLSFNSCNQEIEEVKIGTQVWMKKNLNVDKFRNGDPIPEAKTDQEWTRAGKNKQPAWCYYHNDSRNGDTFGKLYNWYAVNDPRGLAPEGWHIPSEKEWIKLVDYLGGADVAGNKLKSTNIWLVSAEDLGIEQGTDESGFSGLPAGSRVVYDYPPEGGRVVFDYSFHDLYIHCVWWSSTEFDATDAWFINLFNNVGTGLKVNKECGFSVRCLRD